MERENLIAKAEININTTVDEVWDALINPEKIKQYMFGATVLSEWKPGSAISWKGEMNGKKYEDRGEILQASPRKLLQYSHYSPLSKLPDAPENYHIVTIELTGGKDETGVVLTQDKNGSEKEREEAKKKWTAMLESLKKLLEK